MVALRDFLTRGTSQPETPTPGQFTTMCLAIEDVVTGRGFDVDPWQPIETAPKDGSYVLLHTKESTIPVIAQFVLWGGYLGWRDQEGETYINATHWQPMTKPGETTSAIPEAVKAYLRNALMVGGWRGERD